MFTFATITYNHEKYILEHLESIKYQITNYGQDNEFSLIVSDDASKDATIRKIESWLSLNKSLFKQVTILTSDNNQGITKNYIRVVNSISSDCFKVLAGDDLYYKNNIFKVFWNYDLLFSPVIKFESEIMTEIDLITLLLMKYCNLSSIKRLLEYHNFIYAPGVFIKRSIAQDKDLLHFLSHIHWIEDYAKWYYLFHNKNDLTLYYEKQPLVLYRKNSGISTNARHDKNSEYASEVTRLCKEWSLKSCKYPKYINPYKYFMKFIQLKVKYFDSKVDKKMKEKIGTLTEEIQVANQYLSQIRKKAAEFEYTR